MDNEIDEVRQDVQLKYEKIDKRLATVIVLGESLKLRSCSRNPADFIIIYYCSN